jgi:hypothetical protein
MSIVIDATNLAESLKYANLFPGNLLMWKWNDESGKWKVEIGRLNIPISPCPLQRGNETRNIEL